MARYLRPPLSLAFGEPLLLQHHKPDPASWSWPDTADLPRADCMRFFHLLDEAGIFALRRGEVPPYLRAKPFNTRKDTDWDRLIIDRRGSNGAECRIRGLAASNIPSAARLTDLHAERFVQCPLRDGPPRHVLPGRGVG